MFLFVRIHTMYFGEKLNLFALKKTHSTFNHSLTLNGQALYCFANALFCDEKKHRPENVLEYMIVNYKAACLLCAS